MKVLTLGIDKVLLDPANARRHPERNLETIKSSLARFGQQVPIVIDADNVCRKGNGTLLAARALEWDTIRCVKTTLTGTEAAGYAIADNRSSELAEWDDTALAETLRALRVDEVDLAAIGYTDDEVDALVATLGTGLLGDGKPADVPEDPGPQFDRAAELQKKWKTKPGQVWIIPSKTSPGFEHRIIIGDCTDPEVVARVCATEIPSSRSTENEPSGGTRSKA